jgi:hypothetical protein
MPKTIESPYPDEYPGSITIPDGLTFPQLVDFSEALAATRGATDPKNCILSIAAINSIVTWEITNLPDKPKAKDIFVGHLAENAGAFYRWVLAQVAGLYKNEKTVPND